MTQALEAPVPVAADLAKMPPCSYPTHSRGQWGHVPEQAASFLVGAPCGRTWYACAGWVGDALSAPSGRIQCEDCRWHLVGAHTFVPLGDLGSA